MTGDGVFAFDDVAAGSFEFAEDGASAGEKGFADFGEADGAAEAIEQADAEFGFEFEDLLRERRLGDVRMFGGSREAAGGGDGAEVAELVEFHGKSSVIRTAFASYRQCLSIVSELDIGTMGAMYVILLSRGSGRV